MRKSILFFFIFYVGLIYGQTSSQTENGVPEILKVVAFGNSTTAYRKTIEQVYSQRLSGLLMKSGLPAVVYNEGIPGSHTGHQSDDNRFKIPHALDRFEKVVLGENPNVVIICFGINDSWYDEGKEGPRIPLKAYKANLKFMIKSLESKDIDIILMTSNAIGNRFEKWRYENTAQYADVVRKLARHYKLPLIDQWALFEDYGRQEGKAIDDLLLDGMHPNDSWHKRVAEMLNKEILKLYQKKP